MNLDSSAASGVGTKQGSCWEGRRKGLAWEFPFALLIGHVCVLARILLSLTPTVLGGQR